jgi:hypothetical protein
MTRKVRRGIFVALIAAAAAVAFSGASQAHAGQNPTIDGGPIIKKPPAVR